MHKFSPKFWYPTATLHAVCLVSYISSYSKLSPYASHSKRDQSSFTWLTVHEAPFTDPQVTFMTTYCRLEPRQLSQYSDWATGWTTGFPFPARAYFLFSSLCHRVQTSSGVHTATIEWIRLVLSPRIKRSEREADHSLPSSAEVKNPCSCTSTPPYVDMPWCLIKHRIRLHGVVLS
jgi:hypothetical protein